MAPDRHVTDTACFRPAASVCGRRCRQGFTQRRVARCRVVPRGCRVLHCQGHREVTADVLSIKDGRILDQRMYAILGEEAERQAP